jgi:hypothetical protein
MNSDSRRAAAKETSANALNAGSAESKSELLDSSS